MQDTVIQLRQLFPWLSDAQLQSAVASVHGDLERAAEMLLQQPPETSQVKSRNYLRPSAKQVSSPGQGHLSWANLRSNTVSGPTHNQSSRSAPTSPHRPSKPAVTAGSAQDFSPMYVRHRGGTLSPPPPTADSFPSLHCTAASSKRQLQLEPNARPQQTVALQSATSSGSQLGSSSSSSSTQPAGIARQKNQRGKPFTRSKSASCCADMAKLGIQPSHGANQQPIPSNANAAVAVPSQLIQADDSQGGSSASRQDVYHQMRGEALRLTHKWQKVLHRASTARAAGNHNNAKELFAEARALKEAADAAHAAAAVKIEMANNMNSEAGLWELDLHGLHIKEALQALQQRLQLLQCLVQELMHSSAVQRAVQGSQLQDGYINSNGHSHGSSAGAVAGGLYTSRQQLLAQLCLSVDQSQHAQLAAARQELTVIVGKGNHSSRGEASLPRAVEGWLIDAQYKYTWKGGAIDVKLKRSCYNL